MTGKRRFLIPSIADFFFLLAFIILCFSPLGAILLADPDTGWHIRAGEYMLKTRSIPKYDVFSFFVPPLQWPTHEWLSDVIMAQINRVFGLTGLVTFFAFLISLTCYLLFKMVRRSAGDIISCMFIVLLAVLASSVHWLARPHVFSLLLTLISCHILDEFQYRGKCYLYVLPAMMLVWVNLHGSFIIGVILICIYLAANLKEYVTSSGSEREAYRTKVQLLGLTAIFCILVSLLNPNGYHALLLPFGTVSNKLIVDNTQEWLSPNFHQIMPFEFLLLLTIGILGLSRKGTSLLELALLIPFAHMALFSIRNIPLFSIIAAPILARHADSILKSADGKPIMFLRQRSKNIAEVDASARGYFWLILPLLVVCGLVYTGSLKHGFSPVRHPVAAVEFMKKERIKGNMFNDYDFGGYIIYSAYPAYKVFIDGRADVYGDEKLREYYGVARLETGWETVLTKYRINWIIFSTASPLSRCLAWNNGWRIIYSDKVATIFVRNLPENRDILGKYRNVKLSEAPESGWDGLIDNKNNYQRVTYDLLAALAPEDRRMRVRRV